MIDIKRFAERTVERQSFSLPLKEKLYDIIILVCGLYYSWRIILGKLVRDKIPQIIQADGKSPIIRTLSEEDYLQELDKKLNEEVAEYQADKSIEEMADVLEPLMILPCELQSI